MASYQVNSLESLADTLVSIRILADEAGHSPSSSFGNRLSF
ncbi:MAG: hypothetical protein QW177_00955 [Candidatus Nitrosotenuis sp.]